MKFIKLFSGSNMRLTEDILLWYTAISNAVLLDFINKATRAAIFKLSPGFHSAQHRDTRRETRERFISRQIIRQNSSSDLYLDGLSVWRMIRLDVRCDRCDKVILERSMTELTSHKPNYKLGQGSPLACRSGNLQLRFTFLSFLAWNYLNVHKNKPSFSKINCF